MVQTSMAFDTSHHGTLHDAQLDYYGKILATASSDSTIRLWDVSGDAPSFLAELTGHEGPVWQVSWSHPKFGSLLASCSYDRRIFVWRERGPGHGWGVIFRSEEHTSSVNSVCFSPWEFGLHLAAASSDGSASVLTYRTDLGTWTRKAFQAHPNGTLAVSWGPATFPTGAVPPAGNAQGTPHAQAPRRLVTGGCDFQVRLWSYVDATEEWILSHHLTAEKPHTGWVRDVAWRPAVGGANNIASCSDDGTVMIWIETDSQSWKCKQTIELGAPVWKVSWSVTGTVLAVTSGVNHLTLYKENLSGVWESINTTLASDFASVKEPPMSTTTPTAAAPPPSVPSFQQQQQQPLRAGFYQ